MANIDIKAQFDGSSVKTGLERIAAQANKFGQDFEKSLGVGSLNGIISSFIAGFGALQVKDAVVNSFKTMADEAERAADASERMRAAVNTTIRQNSNAEGRLSNSKSDVKGDQAALANVESRITAFIDQYGMDYRDANPVAAFVHSATHPGMRDYFNGMLAEKNTLQERIQTGAGTMSVEDRAIRTANRHSTDQLAAESDKADVAYGRISAADAAKREAERKAREAIAIYQDPTASAADRKAATAASRAADTALIPIEFRSEFARRQGVGPQISASSLAQIGGGGNVNAFGGRAGALETEARLHSDLLRTIANNTAKTESGSGDIKH